MFIHRASAFLTDPVDNPQVLKEDLKQLTEVHFRRVNKFIMLALLGVHQCTAGMAIPESTSIYLTTERGNLADTENVLSQIYRKHSLPMPYNFINTMANTASFYIAQSLKLVGRNITLASHNLSFERGLELLMADIRSQAVDSALIGGVDELNPSEILFQKRFGIPYSRVRHVEGSSWLYVRPQAEGAIGEIIAVKSFKDRKDATAWLRAAEMGGLPTLIAFGMAIPPDERTHWQEIARPAVEFNYIRDHGYFDSITSCGVGLFLKNYRTRQLLHINKDLQNHYVLLLIQRY